MENTSPMMLSTSPAILSFALYSLIPRTMPIIEVICPTRANTQANIIPTIPRIIGAGFVFFSSAVCTGAELFLCFGVCFVNELYLIGGYSTLDKFFSYIIIHGKITVVFRS